MTPHEFRSEPPLAAGRAVQARSAVEARSAVSKRLADAEQELRVLVSHPTAVREHAISIVPNAPHPISPTHDAAVSDGRSEADAMGVGGWLTEDHTHVARIASHRAPDK